MMAELLLYLIAKGLISRSVHPGNKALLGYAAGLARLPVLPQRKEDLLELLVPYFRQGLEKNEACVWMVGDLSVDEARNALAAAVPDLDQYLSSGQMVIRHYTEFYTHEDGTVKPADTLRDDFAAMEFIGAGERVSRPARVRVVWAGSMAIDTMSRFMEYETKVHCAIQDSRMMAVCTYPARAASLTASRELIHNHGNIFVKRGEWVHDNSRDAKKIEAVFAALAERVIMASPAGGNLGPTGNRTAITTLCAKRTPSSCSVTIIVRSRPPTAGPD